MHFMARRDGERMRLERQKDKTTKRQTRKKGQISEEMRTPRDVYVEHSCDGLYLFIARQDMARAAGNSEPSIWTLFNGSLFSKVARYIFASAFIDILGFFRTFLQMKNLQCLLCLVSLLNLFCPL